MLQTDWQKSICKEHKERGTCNECPMNWRHQPELMCMANSHYDGKRKEWVPDGSAG